jgi:hypothetical protein
MTAAKEAVGFSDLLRGLADAQTVQDVINLLDLVGLAFIAGGRLEFDPLARTIPA